jgi:hypothetical protein
MNKFSLIVRYYRKYQNNSKYNVQFILKDLLVIFPYSSTIKKNYIITKFIDNLDITSKNL